MIVRTCLIVATASLALACSAGAQESVELAPGQRVLVHLTNRPALHGTVGLVNDSVLVIWKGRRPPIEFSATHIRSVQVATSGRRYGEGALRGLKWGFIIGAGLGALTLDGTAVAVGAFTGPMIGVPLGLLLAPREWSAGQMPAATAHPARMTDGRTGAVLSLAF